MNNLLCLLTLFLNLNLFSKTEFPKFADHIKSTTKNYEKQLKVASYEDKVDQDASGVDQDQSDALLKIRSFKQSLAK